MNTHTHRSEKWDSQGDVFSLSNLSPLDVCSLWKIYAHREDLPLGSGDMTRLIFTQTMNQEDLNHSEKIDAMWDLLCDLGTRIVKSSYRYLEILIGYNVTRARQK